MKPANFRSRLITVEGDGGPFYYQPDIRFCDPNPAPLRLSPPVRKNQARGFFHVFPLLLALLLLGGCAHVAKHYDAPDSSKLRASAGKLSQKVTEAKATAARASAAVSAAKVSVDRETKQIAEIAPRVENLLRVSPVELRPEIEALKSEVEELRISHEETVSHVTTAKSEQSTLAGQLEEANAAKNEVAQYSPEYFAKVDKQAGELNAAQIAWAKDSAELLKIKSESWFHRILGCLALLAIGALGFLWFTGKFAIGGTKAAAVIAAKVS